MTRYELSFESQHQEEDTYRGSVPFRILDITDSLIIYQ